MTYQVLARKWRPRGFAEMVGQEQVRQALSNALDSDRLHHAYLFTGTRGVGKTTIARILAKCFNCETGVSSKPCGQCGVCKEVDEGRFLDLIEVDAASRTGVDDTRELLENVRFPPAKGRYKVYLIDEVHMFSKHSFNALLKTLEEPPPYVKFLLATTDPQKIPPTVLSRCLQFHLRALSPASIRGQLESILLAESVDYDARAVQEVSLAARGSMRDALSILDQAIAFGGGRLVGDELCNMLGVLGRDRVKEIIAALIARDGALLLQIVEQLAQQSADFSILLEELLAALHHLAVMKTVPGAAPVEDQAELESLRNLAERLAEEEIQLYYQIGLLGRRDLPFAADQRSGLEMTLLRMLAFRPLDAPEPSGTPANTAPAASSKPTRAGATPAEPAGKPVAPLAAAPAAAMALPEQSPESRLTPPPAADSVTKKPPFEIGFEEKLQKPWEEIVPHLHVSGFSKELLHNAAFRERVGHTFYFVVDESRKALLRQSAETRLQQALSEWLGGDVRAVFTLDNHRQQTPADHLRHQAEQRRREAITALREDPLVQDFEKIFDAQLDEQSVKPRENRS